MIVQLDDSKYLVVNQFSGAINLVRASWWDGLGMSPLFGGPKVKDPHVDFRDLLADSKVTMGEFSLLDRLGYFLTREKRDELELKIATFAQEKVQTRPHTVFITPNLSCPLGCVYCFENKVRTVEGKQARLTVGDIKYIDRFITLYRQTRKLRPDRVAVVLFGGEPLVSGLKEFNTRIIELAVSKGYYWRVNTSGVTLDNYYLDLLARNRGNLQEVDVTVDGPEEIHNQLRGLSGGQGSFRLIKKNVEKLIDRNIRLMVKTNLGKDTIQSLEEFVNDMLGYGWFEHNCFLYATNLVRAFGKTFAAGQEDQEDYITLKLVELFRKPNYTVLLPKVRFEGLRVTEYLASAFGLLTYVDGNAQVVNNFDAYPKHAFCHPNDGTSLNIYCNGDVYSCNWMAGREGYSLGNVFEDCSVSEITSNLGAYQIPTINRPSCRDCSISTLCGGGCLMEREGGVDYSANCFSNTFPIIERFVIECARRHWFGTDLKGANIITIKDGFDLNYRYENRTDRK